MSLRRTISLPPVVQQPGLGLAWSEQPLQQQQTGPVPPAPAPAPAPEPPAPPAPTPDAPANPAPLSLTQDDLNRITAAEKAQGHRAGAREAQEKLAEQLGCTVDEAKDIIARHRAAEDATKSQAQKDADAAAAAKKAADDDRVAAAQERRAATVERALSAAGATEGSLTRLAVQPEIVALAPDATAEDITAAVEAVKVAVPAMFGAPAPAGTPQPSGLPAPGAPRTTPPATTTMDAAKEQARALQVKLGYRQPEPAKTG